jgi:hypothetical protein
MEATPASKWQLKNMLALLSTVIRPFEAGRLGDEYVIRHAMPYFIPSDRGNGGHR